MIELNDTRNMIIGSLTCLTYLRQISLFSDLQKNDSYFTFCSQEEDIETSDFEVDYDFFYEAIWPKLAHRIPLFECIKVRNVSEYLIETCF